MSRLLGGTVLSGVMAFCAIQFGGAAYINSSNERQLEFKSCKGMSNGLYNDKPQRGNLSCGLHVLFNRDSAELGWDTPKNVRNAVNLATQWDEGKIAPEQEASISQCIEYAYERASKSQNGKSSVNYRHYTKQYLIGALIKSKDGKSCPQVESLDLTINQ